MNRLIRDSPHRAMTVIVRALLGSCAVLLLVLATGCASLPRDVVRPVSQAIAGSPDTALGRIAAASTPDPGLSGFRLVSWSAQALSMRLELAKRAERSLDVQYYVIHDDDTGRALLRALRDASLRGVRVRLLVDDLYTADTDPVLLGLAAYPNVEVRLFNPFPVGRNSLSARLMASLFDFGRVNHRMHNKLFIADGVMAVAGGRNIGNEYFMVHEAANYIDLDAFATGAVVPTLAALFDQYWNSEHVFPVQSIVPPDEDTPARQATFERRTAASAVALPAPPAGALDVLDQRSIAEELAEGRLQLIWAPAEAFADSPDKVIHHRRRWLPGARQGDEPSVRRGLMDQLLLGREEVLLSSPYFVPNADVIEDIREGRLWGLTITIITNSLASTDEPLVHAGYRRYRREMLDLGVELYEVAPSRVSRGVKLGSFGQSIGRFHAKAAAVDGKVLFIGSLNFDPRSEKHNTELGLLVRSPELTQQLGKLADIVKTEAAYRVRLNRDTGRIEWTLPDRAGGETLTDEPDSTWLQRLLLNIVGPLVPEDHL